MSAKLNSAQDRPSRVHVFTSAAVNYGCKTEVLFRSLREYCPEFMLHWLVPDLRHKKLETSPAGELSDEIHYAPELSESFTTSWLFKHQIIELCTAVKPCMAMKLLERPDCDIVLYFDPDIAVFSPLHDLVAEAAEANVLLTPHLCEPEQLPGAVIDNEVAALKHGVFNLGFFGVRDTAESKRFLQWWHDRNVLYCRADLASGAFTDQKWINFAPIFFDEVRILKNPRFNVAAWNITQRQVEGSFDDSFYVNGSPLGFYHFTGIDRGAHDRVIRAYAAENRSIALLLQWYKEAISLNATANNTWRLACYDDGSEISDHDRNVYRSLPDVQKQYPNPYACGPGSYRAWLKTQDALKAMRGPE